MFQERPLIMISNDDGIHSRGIRLLAEVASRHGDVLVVAPNREYSGQSHSITVGDALTVVEHDLHIPGVKGYAVSGSPVDCIKLGFHALTAGRRPSLVLSGINHGSNLSSSVHYSGTLGAAREGALLGVPSFGFSVNDYAPDADMSHAASVADRVISWALSSQLPSDIFFGVNVPKGPVKGLRPARIANGHWREDYHSAVDPWGSTYYWLIGTFIDDDDDPQRDTLLVEQGYATISAIRVDVNAHFNFDSLCNNI